jgi:orotate phosphoribosyltransferase
MTGNEVLQIFRESGALLEGHFVLRSGLHSRQYFQCALALQRMPVVEQLGAELAGKVSSLGAVTVISPAMGGLVLGQEVARQLGLRFIFVEKEQGKLALRRGFQIPLGEKILVVEDVVTKGGPRSGNLGHCPRARRAGRRHCHGGGSLGRHGLSSACRCSA